MLFALKTNTTVYIAVNAKHYLPGNLTLECFSIPDNLPFFFANDNTSVLIASSEGYREIDLLRYEKSLIKTFNLESLITVTLPKMVKIFDKYFLIEKNGEFRQRWLFAKDNQLFLMHYDKSVTLLTSYFTSAHSDFVESCLTVYKDYSATKQIQLVFEMIEKQFQELAYPIVIIDTLSKKVQYINK